MKTPQVKPDWPTGIYNGRTVMTHKETRTKKGRNWKARDYLKWYANQSDSHVSHNIADDYLYAMPLDEKKILSRLVDDIAHDISRDRKRRLAEEQLFDGEELVRW